MLLALLLVIQIAAPVPPTTLRFAPAVAVPTGAGFLPTGIEAADLGGDGWNEILTADSFNGTLTVLHNQGGGSFLPTSVALEAGQVRDVSVADVNGDGVPDVVASQRGGAATLVVFEGLGSGVLDTPRAFGASQFSSDVELCDLDLDGDLDAVVASMRGVGDPQATVFLQDGQGGFGTSVDHVFLTGAPFSYDTTLAVGDADGNGIPDLVGSSQPNMALVGLLRGLGGGDFAPVERIDVGVLVPMALVLRDLDGDGDDDLAVYDGFFSNPRVVSAKNDGSGSFLGLTSLSTGGSVGSEEARRAMAFADFTGNGTLELVTSNAFGIQTPQGFELQGSASFGFEADAVDVDGDGRPDALIASRDSNLDAVVAIHLNRSQSVFGRRRPTLMR